MAGTYTLSLSDIDGGEQLRLEVTEILNNFYTRM